MDFVESIPPQRAQLFIEHGLDSLGVLTLAVDGRAMLDFTPTRRGLDPLVVFHMNLAVEVLKFYHQDAILGEDQYIKF